MLSNVLWIAENLVCSLEKNSRNNKRFATVRNSSQSFRSVNGIFIRSHSTVSSLQPTFSIFSERELTFTLAIVVRPSVCLSSVTFVHPTQVIEIFGNLSKSHLIPWPPIDIQVKFYGDHPRGTHPLGELNTRRVAEYSDFGPIERYISETVQDRSEVSINH